MARTLPRLVIGSEIIDSVEGAGSASTVTGAVFSFPRATGAVQDSAPEAETIPCRIRVKGSDPTEVRTRVLEVLEILDTMSTEGFSIEYEDGEPLIEVDPIVALNIRPRTKVTWGKKAALIELDIEVSKTDASIVGTGTWQIQRNTAGRMFVVAKLAYADTATAVADVASMRNGSKRPLWMPDSCEVVEDTDDTGQAQGDFSALALDAFRPVTWTVVWEQKPAHMATSTFDDVKRGKWHVKGTPRPAQDARSGEQPGFDVEITGELEFKTEDTDDFDAADAGSALTPQEMLTAAIACVAEIKIEAEKRVGTTIQLMTELDKGVTGEDGVFTFALHGVSGSSSRVLGWEEDEVLEETFRGQIAEGSDGSEWEFEHSGGDARTIQHSLVVTSIGGPRPYSRPQGARGKNWKRIVRADSQPKVLNAGDTAPRQYRTQYRRVYRFINPEGGAEGNAGIPGAQGFGSAYDDQGYFTPIGPDV